MNANYKSTYTEDTLVQQTTAEYLEQQLGWESVCSTHCDLLLPRLLNREIEV